MGINVRLVRFLVNPDVLSSALKALTVMRLSSREKNEVQVLGGAFKAATTCRPRLKSFRFRWQILSVLPATLRTPQPAKVLSA